MSRKLLATIGAIALSGCVQTGPPPATLTAQCAIPAEQATFDMQALRTEMTVLSLACPDSAKYNAFVRQFKPALQANEKAIVAYYKTHGGQVAHDKFVTELANTMSVRAIAQGTAFCAHDGALFTEAAAVDPGALA